MPGPIDTKILQALHHRPGEVYRAREAHAAMSHRNRPSLSLVSERLARLKKLGYVTEETRSGAGLVAYSVYKISEKGAGYVNSLNATETVHSAAPECSPTRAAE